MPKKNGNNDGKPRGRLTAYAIFVQSSREEHRIYRPDEPVVFADFSRKCAENWKNLNEQEKKRFHDLAEQDKMRYEQQMQSYVSPVGVRGAKRKPAKDPNAPKKALSAFFWFCSEERPRIKGLNPDYGLGDVAKELGKLWSVMDPETKRKYENMAENDKARYEREINEYKLTGTVSGSNANYGQGQMSGEVFFGNM
jgi:high mobility group protein B1